MPMFKNNPIEPKAKIKYWEVEANQKVFHFMLQVNSLRRKQSLYKYTFPLSHALTSLRKMEKNILECSHMR